jgi:hypothetical protein
MSRITLHRPRLTTLPSKLIAAGAALAGAGLAIALAGSLASGGPPVPASTPAPAPAAAPAGDVTAAPEIEPAPEAPPAPQPDLKLGEPTVAFMVDQPVQVQVTRVTAPPPDPGWPASPGRRVVLAEVRITNQGTGPVDLDPPEGNAFWVEMQYGADAQDAEQTGSSDAVAYIDTHRLQPGKTARGTYAFEIPEDESQVLVIVSALSGQLTPDDLSDDIGSSMVWTGKVS